MRYVKPSRVRRAITEINAWWESVQSQKAKHVLGLLALLEKGVDSTGFKVFREEDDFAFWNKYCAVPGKAGEDPYVDPLTRQRRIDSHPHSNVATARKGTFAGSWKAGEYKNQGGQEAWKLAPNYAEIFQKQALRKGKRVSRVPVVDIAAFLFRTEEFPDDATSKTLEERFRQRFPQANADYEKLFEYRDEAADQIFVAERPAEAEYRSAIEEVIIGLAAKPAPPPLEKPAEGSKSALEEDDPVLIQVRELLKLGTSGIILKGPPGTSKTWYARQIAAELVADPAKHVFRVQFHPSYGYEDFVEGYRPDDASKSGFKVIDKVFLDACEVASKLETPVVFIIDEINRGDPARILGELLTYIEHSYRGQTFRVPYTGKECKVPANLVVIGTMNPHDKSITQLDMALVRRFDHIDVKPSSEAVAMFLETSKQFSADQVARVTAWFEILQALLPFGIGHTYFKDVSTPEQLRTVWRYRMLPFCENMLEFDATKQEHVKRSFEAMYAEVLGLQPPATPG